MADEQAAKEASKDGKPSSSPFEERGPPSAAAGTAFCWPFAVQCNRYQRVLVWPALEKAEVVAAGIEYSPPPPPTPKSLGGSSSIGSGSTA